MGGIFRKGGVKQPTHLLLFWALFCPLSAEEFKTADVIHPIVAQLPAPTVIEDLGKSFMAVSSSSEAAAKHVTQGMARLNTSWDFEAYRHFCEAAKLDPDCLMAYWGITMSLAGSQHEFFDQRQKSMERMLDLLEWEQKKKVEKWTELERGYATAAGRLLTEGARGAGEAFRLMSERFPNDVQADLFSKFLLRDGFDDFGKPRLGQIRASEGLFETLEAYPENLSVMSFWVTSQTEAPLNGPALRKNVLPIARKLVRQHPEYAPFQLMLTHAEARCGNAALAILAAEKAVAIYEAYMAKDQVAVFDCEGWVRAKVYLVNLYETKGNHAKALILARELAKVKIAKERVFSRGAGLLLWEGRTAGARIMMARNDKKSFSEGQEFLEILPEEQWFKEESFALYYRDCLAFYLGVRIALSNEDIENGTILKEQFLLRAQALEARQPLAAKTSTYSSWLRATNMLAIAVGELQGMLAELEPEPTKGTAVNWYRAACDRQYRPSNLMPPAIDYPVQLRLGDFYLAGGKFVEAGRAYREGLEARPNHLETLKGYHRALQKLGKKESAAILAKRIEAVAN